MNATKINTLVFLLLVFVSFGQKGKYLRKNKDPEIIRYAQEAIYSRSIMIHENKIYTGNSNGSLYVCGLKGEDPKNLMRGKRFKEMRDLAFVDRYIYGMQSAEYGLLAKLTPSGFEDFVLSNTLWQGVFMNSMDFKDSIGFILGDPKEGYFSLFYTEDSSKTWKKCPGKVEALPDEYAFAASGTTVQVLDDSTFVFVTGGMKSRFFHSTDRGKTWKSTTLPYMNSLSSGGFSICFKDDQNGVIVGGDYKNPDLTLNTAFYTDDGGEFWLNPKNQPNGYRSCVIYVDGIYYACGTNGIDFSEDEGLNWIPFAKGNYFALTYHEGQLYATAPNAEIHVFKGVD